MGAPAEEPAATIVARVGSESITAVELDAPIALALHDVDMQRYRLRRQALESELLRRFEPLPATERVAQVTLEPPLPPRVPIGVDGDRVRPAGEAPVTVLAFCNFESPHCRRLQLTLSQVLPLFPGTVRYAERDLPLEFHRHAGPAAVAARCALEQGNYWRFHDALYAAAVAPDRAALDRAARASNLELDAFGSCLASSRHAPAVAADAAEARALGLAAVPAVFVNGRYASPDVKPSDLVGLVERELAASGVESPRDAPVESLSSVPFQLQGLVTSATPGQGFALLSPSVAPESLGVFREGEAIATGIVLRRITPDGIELLNDGRLERLGFDTRPPATASSAVDERAQAIAAHPHRAVPVTLDRGKVLVLLSDRIALAQALQPVPMTAGGQRLLKLQSVEPGGLYDLLGLEPGDVMLGVNEQPVTEAFNPLWDALEQEGEVRLRVMRSGGLARHFTYRFAE